MYESLLSEVIFKFFISCYLIYLFLMVILNSVWVLFIIFFAVMEYISVFFRLAFFIVSILNTFVVSMLILGDFLIIELFCVYCIVGLGILLMFICREMDCLIFISCLVFSLFLYLSFGWVEKYINFIGKILYKNNI